MINCYTINKCFSEFISPTLKNSSLSVDLSLRHLCSKSFTFSFIAQDQHAFSPCKSDDFIEAKKCNDLDIHFPFTIDHTDQASRLSVRGEPSRVGQEMHLLFCCFMVQYILNNIADLISWLIIVCLRCF